MKVTRHVLDPFGRVLSSETLTRAEVRQLDHNYTFVGVRYELRVNDRPISTMQGGQSYISDSNMWFDGFTADDFEDDEQIATFRRERWMVSR